MIKISAILLIVASFTSSSPTTTTDKLTPSTSENDFGTETTLKSTLDFTDNEPTKFGFETTTKSNWDFTDVTGAFSKYNAKNFDEEEQKTRNDKEKMQNMNGRTSLGSEKEKETLSGQGFQKRFAELIEKNLEQILSKNLSEEKPIEESKSNMDLLKPTSDAPVVLNDYQQEETTSGTTLEKASPTSQPHPEAKHSLQNKEVAADNPETVVEMMNRLKEQMKKLTMVQLAPQVDNVTLAGRSYVAGLTTTEHPVEREEEATMEAPRGPVPCTCAIFLSGQFKKGSKDQPKGVPVLTQEMDTPFLNNVVGNRQCTNKCLELIIKHLPKSSEIICAISDRDKIFKEKAYLFIKNWSDKWIATNLSAGREFCCKENLPYKCPMG